MTKRILISLAIIGAVSAIVVGATTAYFSDTETASGNTFTAGTLNLQVGNDDPCTEHITISNIAPGFEMKKKYAIKNTGTIDGRLSISFSAITNKENGRTEPEIEAGDEYGPLDGELGEYLRVSIRVYDPSEGRGWGWAPGPSHVLNKMRDDWHTKQLTEVLPNNPPGLLTAGEDDQYVEIGFTLPEDVGNIVQSDSVEFDIIFKLEQVH